MIIKTQSGRELLNETAYAIIRKQAPMELPLYVEIRERYLKNPSQFLESPADEDEALGMGASTAVITFSHFVFPLLAPMLNELVKELGKAIGEKVGENATNWVRDIFRGSKKSPFSASQLKAIQEELEKVGKAEAKRHDLPPDHVESISNALIAQLAVNGVTGD